MAQQISHLPIKPYSHKILIIFGSFVNGSIKTPRDIDILQRGMTKAEIDEQIEEHFGVSEEEISFDIHDVSDYEKEVLIPVPCDSSCTNYRVIFCDLPVRIFRCTGNLSSVLRDETKSVQDIIRYLSNDSNFGRGSIPVNIGEFDKSDPTNPFTYSSDYVNGRVSLINAVNNHLGKKKFKEVCDGIWWGKLLYLIYSKKPTDSGFKAIARHSPGGSGPDSASFWVRNNPKMIYCTHGFHQEGDKSVDVFIETLYGMESQP